jgi:hypothetical protein
MGNSSRNSEINTVLINGLIKSYNSSTFSKEKQRKGDGKPLSPSGLLAQMISIFWE